MATADTHVQLGNWILSLWFIMQQVTVCWKKAQPPPKIQQQWHKTSAQMKAKLEKRNNNSNTLQWLRRGYFLWSYTHETDNRFIIPTPAPQKRRALHSLVEDDKRLNTQKTKDSNQPTWQTVRSWTVPLHPLHINYETWSLFAPAVCCWRCCSLIQQYWISLSFILQSPAQSSRDSLSLCEINK